MHIISFALCFVCQIQFGEQDVQWGDFYEASNSHNWCDNGPQHCLAKDTHGRTNQETCLMTRECSVVSRWKWLFCLLKKQCVNQSKFVCWAEDCQLLFYLQWLSYSVTEAASVVNILMHWCDAWLVLFVCGFGVASDRLMSHVPLKHLCEILQMWIKL